MENELSKVYGRYMITKDVEDFKANSIVWAVEDSSDCPYCVSDSFFRDEPELVEIIVKDIREHGSTSDDYVVTCDMDNLIEIEIDEYDETIDLLRKSLIEVFNMYGKTERDIERLIDDLDITDEINELRRKFA